MPPMLVPAAGYTLEQLAALFTRGFAGYLVPVQVTAETLAARVRVEAVDLAASRVVIDDDAPVALALIARRGRRCRLAAFGVVEDARGRGLGTRAMTGLIEEARARGDVGMALEVFTANHAAVALYGRLGFAVVRALGGWDGALAAAADPALREIDPGEVARAVARTDDGTLPWQLAPASLAALAAPHRAFALGDALAIAVVRSAALVLSALFTLPAARHGGAATRLVRAMVAELGAERVVIPPIVPVELAAGWCAAVGLPASGLGQHEMWLGW